MIGGAVKAACAAFLVCCFSALAHSHGSEDGDWRAIPQTSAELPVTVQVQRSPLGNQIVVEYHGTGAYTILGDDKRGFLRFTPNGVFANWNHVDWFVTQAAGKRPIPDWVNQDRGDDWRQVASTPSWGWYDRRLVRDGHKDQWQIPARHNQTQQSLSGHFTELKAPDTRLVPRTNHTPTADKRWSVRVIPDVEPALRVSYQGDGQLEALDAAGEPFLRFSSNGVEARVDSESWQLLGRQPLSGKGWRKISSRPSYTWADSRLLSTADADRWQIHFHEVADKPMAHTLAGDWIGVKVRN